MSLVFVFVRTYSGVFLHTVEPEVCKVCFRLQVCFGMVVLVDTEWCFCWTHGSASIEDSLGITWVHLVLLGFTWCHSVSLGVTQFHSDSVLGHLVSLGFT